MQHILWLARQIYPYQQFSLQKGNKSKKIESSFHLFPVFYSDLDYLHYKSGEKRVKKLPFWMIFLSYGLALNLLNNSKQEKIICIGLFHSFWAIQPDHTPKNSSAPSTSSQHSPQAPLPTVHPFPLNFTNQKRAQSHISHGSEPLLFITFSLFLFSVTALNS